jgi:hypothetical protein
MNGVPEEPAKRRFEGLIRIADYGCTDGPAIVPMD